VDVRQRRLVLFVFAAGWLSAAQVGKVPPSLSILRQEFALSLVEAGWFASLIACVAALLGVICGLGAARIGLGRSLMAGLMLICAGAATAVLVSDVVGLLIARVFEAFGFVMVIVAAPSLLAVTLADRPLWRQRALIVWGTYMPVGVAAMMLLAPSLLAFAGWRSLWLLNAALCACLFVLIGRSRQSLSALSPRSSLSTGPARSGPQALSVAQLGEELKLTGPWLMGVSFGCYTAIWFVLVTWLPTFAVSHMGYSLSSASWLTAAAVLLNIAGNLSAQLLASLAVPRWLVLLGVQGLMGSVGWVVFSSGYPDLARAGAAILVCGLAGALPATVFSGIPFHARRHEQIAVGNGIVMQLGSIGTFAGPPAIALIVTYYGGWDAGRWLIPLLAAIGGTAAVFLRGVEQRIEKQNGLLR